jgi:hypothetical protein
MLTRLACVLATVVAVTSSTAALAGPLEVGAGVGLTQTAQDASNGASSQVVDTMFARLRVIGPLAAQAEFGRIYLAGASVLTATADAVVQLGSGRIRPFLLVGAGVDQMSPGDGSPSQTFTRLEAGAGVEVRVTGGLILGLDLRDGSRTDQSPPQEFDEPIAAGAGAGVVRLSPSYVPTTLASGDYRTVRLTVGLAF